MHPRNVGASGKAPWSRVALVVSATVTIMAAGCNREYRVRSPGPQTAAARACFQRCSQEASWDVGPCAQSCPGFVKEYAYCTELPERERATCVQGEELHAGFAYAVGAAAVGLAVILGVGLLFYVAE